MTMASKDEIATREQSGLDHLLRVGSITVEQICQESGGVALPRRAGTSAIWSSKVAYDEITAAPSP